MYVSQKPHDTFPEWCCIPVKSFMDRLIREFRSHFTVRKYKFSCLYHRVFPFVSYKALDFPVNWRYISLSCEYQSILSEQLTLLLS